MKTEISSTEKIARLTANLAFELKSVEEKNAKFIEDFKANPAHALSWSSTTFVNAAKRKVLVISLEVVNKWNKAGMPAEDVIKNLHATATKEALRIARFPARSTSVPSNEIEQQIGAAWAELAEMLAFHAA